MKPDPAVERKRCAERVRTHNERHHGQVGGDNPKCSLRCIAADVEA